MYPTDLEAHLESYGGWTGLSITDSDTLLLTPAKTTISETTLEGGYVKIQSNESGERFWVHVVKYDAETGLVFGLVANQLINTELEPWHPIYFHIFYVWEVSFFLRDGDGLEEGTVDVHLVPPEQAPNEYQSASIRYEGDVNEGALEGYGTMTFPDGHQYVGELKNNLPDGQGKLTFVDETTFTGSYVAGERHGYGVQTYKDGAKFDGEWEHDKWLEGTLAHADGSTYAGQFKDLLYHGNGFFTFANGTTHEGRFKNNVPDGVGTYIGEDDTWEGTWTAGELVTGKLITEEFVYTGEFKDMEPHGYGTFKHLETSFTYKGEFREFAYHGHGTLTVLDEFTYTGQWNDDQMHGQGVMTFPDGSKFVGEFKDDVSYDGTEYDADGNIVATESKGVHTKM